MDKILYCPKCKWESNTDVGEPKTGKCLDCKGDLELVCGHCYGTKKVPVYAYDEDIHRHVEVGEKQCENCKEQPIDMDDDS